MVEARAQVSLDRSDVDNSSSQYSGETNLKKQKGKRKHWTIRNLN